MPGAFTVPGPRPLVLADAAQLSLPRRPPANGEVDLDDRFWCPTVGISYRPVYRRVAGGVDAVKHRFGPVRWVGVVTLGLPWRVEPDDDAAWVGHRVT